MNAGRKRSATQAKCPICGRPVEPAFRPFCSRRCADVDLWRWLDGAYRIQTDEAPPGGRDDELE